MSSNSFNRENLREKGSTPGQRLWLLITVVRRGIVRWAGLSKIFTKCLNSKQLAREWAPTTLMMAPGRAFAVNFEFGLNLIALDYYFKMVEQQINTNMAEDFEDIVDGNSHPSL
jgi:hypothetical protein